MSMEPNDPAAPRPHPERGSERFEEARAQDNDLQRLHDALIREKQEPTERFLPMPLFLVLIISGLAFWAGVYLVQYSADFDAYTFDETLKPGEMVQASGPVEYDPIRVGSRFFTRNCTVCHQANGSGVAGAFPPVADSNWVQGPEEMLIRILLNGMTGPVQVNGESYNGAMPAFATASNEEIAGVLTLLRTDPQFGNNSEPVTPEAVAAVRAELGGRSQAWTGAELQKTYLNQ